MTDLINSTNTLDDVTSYISISQLSVSLAVPATRSIKAVVSLTWPYSSATGSIAFLLSEPDFRLRRVRGQVRVQFSGSSAKIVAKSGVASGDLVILSLDGVEWVQDDNRVAFPGQGVGFELKYTERLLLQFQREDSDELHRIDINHPPEEAPTPLSTRLEPASDAITLESAGKDVYLEVESIVKYEYSSPAFTKRARTSYGSLFAADFDAFSDEDHAVPDRGRKRARLSSTWTYISRSPTPQKEELEINSLYTPTGATGKTAPEMVDEGVQTIGLETESATVILSEVNQQTENVEKISLLRVRGGSTPDQEQNQSQTAFKSTEVSMPPPVSPKIYVTKEYDARPPTPSILPVPSDLLPLVSPLVSNTYPSFLGTKDQEKSNISVERDENAKQKIGHIMSTVEENVDGILKEPGLQNEEDLYSASPRLQRSRLSGSVSPSTTTLDMHVVSNGKAVSNNQLDHVQSPSASLNDPAYPAKRTEVLSEAINQHFENRECRFLADAVPTSNPDTSYVPQFPRYELEGNLTSTWDQNLSSVSYPEPLSLDKQDEHESSAQSAPNSYSGSVPRSRSAQSPLKDLVKSGEESEEVINNREDSREAESSEGLESHDEATSPSHAGNAYNNCYHHLHHEEEEYEGCEEHGEHEQGYTPQSLDQDQFEEDYEGSYEEQDDYEDEQEHTATHHDSVFIDLVSSDEEEEATVDLRPELGQESNGSRGNQTDGNNMNPRVPRQQIVDIKNEKDLIHEEHVQELNEKVQYDDKSEPRPGTELGQRKAIVFKYLDDPEGSENRIALQLNGSDRLNGKLASLDEASEEREMAKDNKNEGEDLEEREMTKEDKNEDENSEPQKEILDHHNSPRAIGLDKNIPNASVEPSAHLLFSSKASPSTTYAGVFDGKNDEGFSQSEIVTNTTSSQYERCFREIDGKCQSSTSEGESRPLPTPEATQIAEKILSKQNLSSQTSSEANIEISSTILDKVEDCKYPRIQDGHSPENREEYREIEQVSDGNESVKRAQTKMTSTISDRVTSPSGPDIVDGVPNLQENLNTYTEISAAIQQELLEESLEIAKTDRLNEMSIQEKPSWQDPDGEAIDERSDTRSWTQQLESLGPRTRATEGLIGRSQSHHDDHLDPALSDPGYTIQTPRRSQRILKSTTPSNADEPLLMASAKSDPDNEVSTNRSGSSKAIIRSQPKVHDASIELALKSLASPSKNRSSPVVDLKLRLSRYLRTELGEFTSLKAIRYQLHHKLDILAIVTTTPPTPQRAKNDPRHYLVTFNITDPTTAPSGVIEVQVFRPFQKALPVVRVGDGILLRNFQVIPLKKREFGLKSKDDGAWAVFTDGGEVEMKGPPVEYGAEEEAYVGQMKSWFAGLDPVAQAKITRANGILEETKRAL